MPGPRLVVVTTDDGVPGHGWPGERRWFALRHRYVYPKLGIAYTYIPKNACSSLKKTFGVAQGWLPKGKGLAHEMRRSWWLEGLRAYRSADERIVVLRDPFDRLLSAYQDRFLNKDRSAADQAMATGLADLLPVGADRSDVTFAQFVRYLSTTPNRRLDEHWRPQSDFLLGSYTRVIRFDHLAEDTAFLADRGLRLRHVTGHGTGSLRADLGPGWGHRPASDLRVMKTEQRTLPSASSMYDDELVALVRRRFARDLTLWQTLVDHGQVVVQEPADPTTRP